MERRRLLGFMVILIILMITLLAACSGEAALEAQPTTPPYVESVGEYVIETVIVEAERPIEAPSADEYVEQDYQEGDESRAKVLQASLPQTDRMIIKDAVMDLLVDNTDIAIAQVGQMAADYGGYIISSQSFLQNDNKYATLRIAVPSGNFENVMNNLRSLAIRVIQETASGQDVTAEYVDLESRLENLEATAARVRTFLEEAETVEEALAVNQELSELEAEIEQVKGQMRFYEGRSAFSTITVSLEPQLPTPTPTPTVTPTPTPTPGPGWDPGETLQTSAGVLESLVKGTITVLIWFLVIVGPFALVALIIFLLVRWIWKRTRKPKSTQSMDQTGQ